jgi:hydroxymethylpyrimidine pyrophosphatase-like HAD family hydrolase
VPLRCVYTDLDGTLLGPGASLFRDAEKGFTLLPARGLEACFRAGVEVVPVSGRRRTTLFEDCRLLGLSSFVFEVGGGMVIDRELTWLTDEAAAYEAIERAGAPRLLLDRFPGRLEYHEPWHEHREVTHLLRGLVDVEEADAALADAGLGHLRLVDNGAIAPKASLPDLDRPHAYHLLPRTASKAAGAAAHMRARGYAREECIGVGDSAEDLGLADVVGRFFLVANAAARPDRPGAEITEAAYGEGFYEAVVRSLAEGAGRIPTL